MKISDKINQVLKQDETRQKKKTYYSFEYFPPKTDSGVENLLERIERMGSTNPLWIDVTWHAGGVTSDITLDLCAHIQNFSGLDVLMHITCTYMTREKVVESLDRAKELGIRNLLALRGDPPRGVQDWTPIENGFNNAYDMVKFIKEQYGDFFCIGVAGYPEVHLEARSREDDIKYLKQKVDAGADFVVTQLFYDNKVFLEWVKDCRAAGINCQLIPGIMPILGYDRFHRMIKFCKTIVDQSLLDQLEPLKSDEEQVRKFGIEFGIKQCQELMENGIQFLHFYTMNLERSVVEIIKGLGIIDTHKQLPFKKPSFKSREKEEVRPIFWAIKPKSYIARTQDWDEFPNGRWGPSRSAAFEIPESYISMNKKMSFNFDEKKKLWGEKITSLEQISEVFINYLTGKIKKFPFAEGSLQLETSIIIDELIKMNKNKLFTINSQPRVNGAKSSDPTYGWGPKTGYVYQKPYYEFFIPPQLLEPLCKYLEQFEDITYQAVNSKGDAKQNVEDDDVNALTWGVFKGREIVQPTVVDHQAFIIWKDEAFQEWIDSWGFIYGTESETYKYFENIQKAFYLVNVVHNDYVEGDLSKIMSDFIDQNQELISQL